MPPNVISGSIRARGHSSGRRASLRAMAGSWVSVVPTFRPPQDAEDLIRTLATSGPVVVSDDASPCTFDSRLSRIAEILNVTMIRNSHNRGIGRALNQGLEFAHDHALPWLLTIDQDSRVDENYSATLVDSANLLVASGVRVGAVGAGRVLDASGPLTYPTRAVPIRGTDVTVTEEVVQSGTLWNTSALIEVGGFDESLGMDAVDAAACLALREADFVVALHPDATLNHQIEGAQQVRFLGRSVMVTGHSPDRRWSIVRNRLRLFPREFAQSPAHSLRTLRRSAVNVLALPLRRKT